MRTFALVWVDFGECKLDIGGRELLRDGEPVAVEPQVFDVIAYLVDNRDRVVTKHELLDNVWGDRFVSESAITSRIKFARRALGDTGRDQRIIRTVHGRGYRFVADLETAGWKAATGTEDDLLAAIHAVASGHGAAIELEGAAGAGKTDRVDRAADEALAHGLVVGCAGPGGLGARPFQCVVDALDEVVQRRPSVLDGLQGGVRAELEQVFEREEPTSRHRLRVALREAAVAAAASGGAVLLFDDTQLADDETRSLVVELGRLSRRHRLLVVAAHGPGRRLGPPFELVELTGAGRAESLPEDHLPTAARELLRLIALSGARFDLVDAGAATGLTAQELDPLLRTALDTGLLEHTGTGYRFVDPAASVRLVAELPEHAQIVARESMAARLAEAGAPPGRVAAQQLAAGNPAAAASFALDAARRAAASQFHVEVLRWTEAARGYLRGTDEAERLSLRADALTATGDPAAVATYRQAIACGPAPGDLPGLRARLARAAMLGGDLASAEEALRGLEPDGGPHDAAILLATGMHAYFTGDLERAELTVDRLRSAALTPGAPDRLLDVITLQGMIAHNRGEWFDRLRRELRATRGNAHLASTVFDSHLCVAEYLLYGPTPYDEVVALVQDLRAEAERTGARRAVAFAATVAGEAALLAGNLETARRDLAEAVELHRQSDGDTGVAHALQRLAEVELASGDPAEADRLLRRALPLARWSPLARHLLQRIYGTLISAAPDTDAAIAVVEEAVATMDDPGSCLFCEVMIAVPAAIACAEAGRPDDARAFLAQAELSARLWQGTAWEAAVAEAKASLSRAEGDDAGADRLLAKAVALFEAAGQPLDAERCAEARR